MGNHCSSCGQELESGARFCSRCGARIDEPQGQEAAVDCSGVPAPGWSDRLSDPALAAALKKQRKSVGRFAALFVPLPLVGFAIYSLVSDRMEFLKALLYGAVISAVFLILSLIGKRQSDPKNAYEAVVVDKQTRLRRRKEGSGDDSSYTTYNELITVARTDAGETKKITERDEGVSIAWDYLPVGARFRFHPQLGFPYELYDKSRAPYLACPVCSRKHALTADRCSRCGAPLLR